MSFYGNIKRIGSQSFQFDRVYSTRKAMDDAISTDDVYPGRYVLVEYGERYTINPSSSERTERAEYKAHREEDLAEYLNVYDSTVWQKVYTKNANSGYTEKYIMVAELNALAPKLTLVEDETATLIKEKDDNGEITPLYYGENNDLLHNVHEIAFNTPYFDEIQDTELEYKLHMPKPLELEVNDTVDYHQDKFDIYHTHIYPDEGTDNAKGNFIGWKPKPEGDEAEKVNNVDDRDLTKGKTIESDTKFSKQELNMYLPAFGDVLGALYDTLFGRASSDGGLRPYFAALGLTQNDFGPDGKIQDVSRFAGDADISRILANNSEGLAGILGALFADNSIPGKVRYYLSADWLAKNTSLETNTPGIVNKPKVVFDNNVKANSSYNSHYQINYSKWFLTNILFNTIASIIGVPSSNDKYLDAIESIDFAAPDHLTITGDLSQFGEGENDKKIAIDIGTNFDSSAEMNQIVIDGNIVTEYHLDTVAGHIICTLDLSKLINDVSSFKIMAPNSEDVDVLIELEAKNYLLRYIELLSSSVEFINQDKVFIIKINKNNYLVFGDLNNLSETEIDGVNGKWIGIDIQTRDLNENAIISIIENKQESENNAIKIGDQVSNGLVQLYLNLNELKQVQTYNESVVSGNESQILRSGIISTTISSDTTYMVGEEEIQYYEDAVLNFHFKNIPLVHSIELLSENAIPNNYNDRDKLINNINNVESIDVDNQDVIITANYQKLIQYWKDNQYKSWIPLIIDPYSSDDANSMENIDFDLANAKVDTYLSPENKIVILTGLEDIITQQTSTISAALKNLYDNNNYRYASDLQADTDIDGDNLLNNVVTSDLTLQFKGVPVLEDISKLSIDHLPTDPNYPIAAGRNNQGYNENATQNFEIIHEDDTYHIFVKTKDGYLTKYQSTDNNQSEGYWIGIVISTNCINDITAIKWNGTNLNSGDVDDANSLNLDDGQIILWLKAESVGERNINLTADYYTDSILKLKIEEYPERTVTYDNNGRGTITMDSVTKYNDEDIIINNYFSSAYYLVDQNKYIAQPSDRTEVENIMTGTITYNLNRPNNDAIWPNPNNGIATWYSKVYTYNQVFWSLSSSDTTADIDNAIESGTIYSDSEDMQLYAIWNNNYTTITSASRAYTVPYSSSNVLPYYEDTNGVITIDYDTQTDGNNNVDPESTTAIINRHFDFKEWNTKDDGTGNVRITTATQGGATGPETVYAIYNSTPAQYYVNITLPSWSRDDNTTACYWEKHKLLGWAQSHIETEPTDESWVPGANIIYSSPSPISNLTLYAIWQQYLTYTFNANGKGNNQTMDVEPNSTIGLPEYLDDYIVEIAHPLTITIDSTDIDDWDTTSGTSTTASATYAYSQTRYQQIGWNHANDNNSPYVEYDNFNTNNSDEEFIALWNTGNTESIEPIGLSYIVPSAIPIKNDITENTGYTVTYYYTDTNNEIQQLMQVPITKTIDYSFDSWIEVNTEEIRTNNSRVTSNETIKPVFISTDNGNNATILYNDALPNNIVYSGWETLNHSERFLPGDTIIFDNSIELYAYLGL